jgi:signal transduction histidine kinase
VPPTVVTPNPIAEPTDRRPVDLLLAGAAAAGVAVAISVDLGSRPSLAALAYLLVPVFGALMLARRQAPRLVLVLTVPAVVVYAALGFPAIGIALPALAALYSAADRGRARLAVGVGLLLVAVTGLLDAGAGGPAAYAVRYEFLTNVALVAAAIALGVAVRTRRDFRLHQERLREVMASKEEREAEQRQQDERIRMANDLHNAVGNTMSVIAVHGDVAAGAIGRDDEVVRRSVDQIRRATTSTMRELRNTVKLLRPPGADGERETVGLAGLGRLADGAREAGVQVDLDVVLPAKLDGAIDATAYRIVQESLTNVIRHSGARRARVKARVRNDRMELVIADDGRGGEQIRARAGAELAGVRQRAALLGGELDAGDDDAGGFIVRALLPVRLDA